MIASFARRAVILTDKNMPVSIKISTNMLHTIKAARSPVRGITRTLVRAAFV